MVKEDVTRKLAACSNQSLLSLKMYLSKRACDRSLPNTKQMELGSYLSLDPEEVGLGSSVKERLGLYVLSFFFFFLFFRN